jgi:glycosyltransferase involved in cell wall biosynthesis
MRSDASSDSGSMRILKVADVRGIGIGGINSFMRKTGAELIRQGHRVDYLFQEDLGPRLIPRPLRRLLVPWLITWKVFRRQRRGAGYSVVEIQEWTAGAYPLVRKLLPALGLPPCVVISYGAAERQWRAQRERWQAVGRRGSLKSRLWFPISLLPQSRYALANADHVLVSSKKDAEYVNAKLGVERERIGRADSAVGSEYFSLQKRSRGDEETRLLFIGHWIDRKGIREMSAAWSSLCRHRSLRLTLACTVKPEQAVLESFNGDRDRITVMPRLSEEELKEVIVGHDLFVLPAWFEGGAPIAAIQAAAAGLPCVVTDIGGNADVFRPQDPQADGGLLIAPHDADGLTKAIERLVREPELAERLGRSAKARARDFTWEVTAAQSLTAYIAAAATDDAQRLVPQRA